MKTKAIVALFLLTLTGCKVQMDDCYRAIYDYVGPAGADSFVMEVTQKGRIEGLDVLDDQIVAWVRTEPDMWTEVALPLDADYDMGDRVVVSFLVKFRKGGKLDIIEKRLE